MSPVLFMKKITPRKIWLLTVPVRYGIRINCSHENLDHPGNFGCLRYRYGMISGSTVLMRMWITPDILVAYGTGTVQYLGTNTFGTVSGSTDLRRMWIVPDIFIAYGTYRYLRYGIRINWSHRECIHYVRVAAPRIRLVGVGHRADKYELKIKGTATLALGGEFFALQSTVGLGRFNYRPRTLKVFKSTKFLMFYLITHKNKQLGVPYGKRTDFLL